MREERFLKKDRAIIQEWCDALGIGNDDVLSVYLEMIGAGILGPRRVSTVIAAAIYISARRNNEPITIQNVVKCTGEAKPILEKTIRSIGGSMPPQDPDVFAKKGFRRLKLPDDTPYRIDDIRIDLGAPVRAAAAIFVAAHKVQPDVTIRDVAGAVGVTAETLRKYVSSDGTLKKNAR